ncbi:hypothetical protein RugamoR64_18790 [Duganella rhizosphaerae]|uniref:hypothetical protein n=1 Tax=Duganella rhizosphaerae TaxID=2885763 RepID=UPI0030E9F598
MTKLSVCLFLLLFVILAAIATWPASLLGSDFQLTCLAVVVAYSLLLSLALAVQRRRLRRQFMQLSKAERNALAADSEQFRYILPAPGSRPASLTAFVGVALVNGPILPLMVGPIFVMQTWFSVEPPIPQFLALGGGFAAAWFWWSIAVSFWRRWAQAGGMSAEEVQYHGQRINILWPKGHFFERTEWGRWRKPVAIDAAER